MAAQAETASSFNSVTDSAHANGQWQIFLIHTINPTSDNWYNPVDIVDVKAGMSYGKSLGDVWMDSVVHVASYWIGQKLLTAATATKAGTDMTWTWTWPGIYPPNSCVRVTVDGGTLKQNGTELNWNDHGYYEVTLDVGSLTLSP